MPPPLEASLTGVPGPGPQEAGNGGNTHRRPWPSLQHDGLAREDHCSPPPALKSADHTNLRLPLMLH